MSTQAKKTHPVVGRVAVIGAITGVFVASSAHTVLGLEPVAAGFGGGVIGLIMGSIIGSILVDQHGVVAGFFSLIGALIGGVLCGAIVNSAGGSEGVIALAVLVGLPLGARIGLLFDGIFRRLLIVSVLLGWLLLGPGPIGKLVRDQMWPKTTTPTRAAALY